MTSRSIRTTTRSQRPAPRASASARISLRADQRARRRASWRRRWRRSSDSPREAPFEAIVVDPAFDMYAASHGRRRRPDRRGAARTPDFAFPLDGVLAAITPRTRVVFLTNPNNPTGAAVRSTAIRDDRATRPAGAACSSTRPTPSSPAQTLHRPRASTRFPNVVVGRTFSKAFGLAGLRVGALVGAPDDARADPPRRAAVQRQRRARRSRCRRRSRIVDYLRLVPARRSRESKALLYRRAAIGSG